MVIVTILVVSALVAIGLGLGLGLRDRSTPGNKAEANQCPESTTTPTTTASPLHNPPSASEEGHYRFAAVAADAAECSQIGT